MTSLTLHNWHGRHGAQFTALNGLEVVAHYGDPAAELAALSGSAGLVDLSFRSRVCLLGKDRARFLHGQVTNDVNALRPGSGLYAAVVSAKGKMETDLNVLCLEEELLLDFEPGLSERVMERLNRFLVADEVEIIDVAPLYGLLSVQGAQARPVVLECWPGAELPEGEFKHVKIAVPEGEVYLVDHGRYGGPGIDIFLPVEGLADTAGRLLDLVQARGGRLVGWEACEVARVRAGVPRYGVDMDATTFPQEAGIDDRAVSYRKGCYIGQEILNRIHTMGHVNRQLHRFRAVGDGEVPDPGAKIISGGTEAGVITSAVRDPLAGDVFCLGYVRRGASGDLSVTGWALEPLA